MMGRGLKQNRFMRKSVVSFSVNLNCLVPVTPWNTIEAKSNVLTMYRALDPVMVIKVHKKSTATSGSL